MKPMTQQLRDKIKMFIKNGNDISQLIEGVEIKNEDFRYAIIKRFDRIKDNLSGLNLSNATIGTKGKVVNLSNSIMHNVRFCDTEFIGKVFMRRCDCEDSDFSGANLSNLEYQYTNFARCKFCETIIRLGSDYGFNAKFDTNLFKDLTKNWNLDVRFKDENDKTN